MLALAENALVSHVRSGENNGRKLGHVAVVRRLTVLVGTLDLAGALSRYPDYRELAQWNGKRIIAIVQDRQSGRIHVATSGFLLQLVNKVMVCRTEVE